MHPYPAAGCVPTRPGHVTSTSTCDHVCMRTASSHHITADIVLRYCAPYLFEATLHNGIIACSTGDQAGWLRDCATQCVPGWSVCIK